MLDRSLFCLLVSTNVKQAKTYVQPGTVRQTQIVNSHRPAHNVNKILYMRGDKRQVGGLEIHVSSNDPKENNIFLVRRTVSSVLPVTVTSLNCVLPLLELLNTPCAGSNIPF
jgi:hypothetical protein